MSDRKQYTAEFKRDAVRLMTEGKQSPSEVARTLGVNVGLLGKWRRQLALAEEVQAAGRNGYEAFPGQGRAHDEELARLRKENATLKMERDVLKKPSRSSRRQCPNEVRVYSHTTGKHKSGAFTLERWSSLPHFGRFAQRLFGLAAATKTTSERDSAGQATG